MLLTNLILLLALVVMVGIAIWLFRDGEGVGPTPYIRPFEDDGGAAGDDRSRSEPSSSVQSRQSLGPEPSADKNSRGERC